MMNRETLKKLIEEPKELKNHADRCICCARWIEKINKLLESEPEPKELTKKLREPAINPQKMGRMTWKECLLDSCDIIDRLTAEKRSDTLKLKHANSLNKVLVNNAQKELNIREQLQDENKKLKQTLLNAKDEALK